MLLKIAFRSIFRNSRRSVMTLSTIMVGAVANLVFGGYMIYVFLGIQTGAVIRTGHLTVFRNGYFDFGSGNPAAYALDDYQGLLKLIQADPFLQPRIAVATPTQAIAGIAGNFEADASKTFFGVGFIPSDRDRMRQWNAYGLSTIRDPDSGLRDADPSRGNIGIGLARILGLCERLHVDNCPRPPQTAAAAVPAVKGPPADDLAELAKRDRPSGPAAPAGNEPRIDLLAATAGGAPNVVSLYVARAEYQSVKEYDDNYVGMNLTMAQQLLYGRGKPKATGIVVQLKRTEDLAAARERLLTLFREHKLDLEVRDFTELSAGYKQIIGLFASIFTFISIIIGVVVLFTVTNTIGMSVMERTNEIGTSRALGIRRAGIRRQFLLEGSLLGVMGATFGVAVAAVIAYGVNHSGLTWLPPGNSQPVPLQLYVFGRWSLIAGVWIGLVLVATIAALLPANRAAKLPVVDALRHV